MEKGILGQCYNTRDTPIRKRQKKTLWYCCRVSPAAGMYSAAKGKGHSEYIETINDLHFPGIWFFFFK
jgi:hypothetical protein